MERVDTEWRGWIQKARLYTAAVRISERDSTIATVHNTNFSTSHKLLVLLLVPYIYFEYAILAILISIKPMQIWADDFHSN